MRGHTLSRPGCTALLLLISACAGQRAVAPNAVSVGAHAEATPAEQDALELRVEMQAKALREQGFAPAGLRDRGFLPSNGRVTRPVTIEAHTCAKFVAVATPSVIDLDASIYLPDGVPLLEDDGSDARPELTLCAGDTAVEGYFALHAYQGVGAFATAQFVRPAIAGDDLITRGAQGGTALAELASFLHKRGFEDAAPRVDLDLPHNRPVRVAVPARQGSCYTLAVERPAQVSGLTLRLLDAADREVSNGRDDGGLTSLQFCAERNEELALEVRAASGEGRVRVARFRAPLSAVGGTHALWLGEPSPTPEAWGQSPRKSEAEVRKELSARGISRFVIEERKLSQGAVTELETKAALAPCETWEMLLQPGLARATLRLETLDGHVLAEAQSQGMQAHVSVCERRGPVRVSAIGRAGFGQVTLVGRAKEQTKPREGEPEKPNVDPSTLPIADGK